MSFLPATPTGSTFAHVTLPNFPICAFAHSLTRLSFPTHSLSISLAPFQISSSSFSFNRFFSSRIRETARKSLLAIISANGSKPLSLAFFARVLLAFASGLIVRHNSSMSRSVIVVAVSSSLRIFSRARSIFSLSLLSKSDDSNDDLVFDSISSIARKIFSLNFSFFSSSSNVSLICLISTSLIACP